MSHDSILPLVSCIMPTRDRRDFVFQAIQYFQRQDYPSRELLIIDDATQDLSMELPNDSRIRYILEPPGLSVGAKRNRGCELARGQIIAHWDDDDWYAPSRLSSQVQPIVTGSADISAFSDCTFFDLSQWMFWRCTPVIFGRMYVGGAHAGTLVYRRKLFELGIRYPRVSLAEDAHFLYQCHQRGATVQHLLSGNLFLYVRHSQSTWKFTCGEYIDARQWTRVPEPDIPEADRQFFEVRSTAKRGLESVSPPPQRLQHGR
jgi:O-antigen biosynthesis protein